MTVNWFGQWQILVAFNNTVADDLTAITTVATPPTLGARNVWTDITQYALDLKTHRGKQHLIDQFVAGTADLTLWNGPTQTASDHAGRFDTWNTSSPYAGLILPERPILIQNTINGVTYPVYTGYTDVWATNWADEVRSTVTLSCVDAFQAFTNAYTVSKQYPTQILADGATYYWRLSEPAGATSAFDTATSLYDGNYQGTYTLGNGGALPLDAATSVNLGNATGYVTVRPPAGPLNGSSVISIEAWINVSALPASTAVIWQADSAGAGKIGLILNSTGTIELLMVDDASNFVAGTSTGTVTTGTWHYVAGVFNAGAVTIDIDNVAVAVSTSSSGSVGNWTPIAAGIGGAAAGTVVQGPSLSGSMQEVAVYAGTALTPTQLANHYSLAVGLGAELSGSRLNRILNWIGWPAGPRNIDNGSSNVQAISQSLTGTTILAYLQLVELSENGALFMDRSGNVRFVARQNLLLSPYNTSQQTFGDGGGEVPFEPVPQIAMDTIDLYRAALVQRQGGVIQQAPTPPPPMARTYQPSQLLITTDLEALAYAQWEVAHLSVPLQRVRQITVHPLTDPTGGTAAQAVLARELMDRITVNRHNPPGGGTPFSIVSLIEGIDHQVDFTKGDWTVTFALDPADSQTYWVWGTSEWDTTPPASTVPTRWAY